MRAFVVICTFIAASPLFSTSASRADEQAAPPPWPAPMAPPVCRPSWSEPCSAPRYQPDVQAAPRVLLWNEIQAIPPGYHKATEVRSGLVIGGALTFGTAWVPSAISGSFSAYLLVIPVAGPIITAAIYPVDIGWNSLRGWLVVDGLQQAAGLVMLIAGLAAPRTVLLRSDAKAARTWWLPTPMSFGKGSTGLGILGTM